MGLTDICATVTVSKGEYERLLRDSEKMEVLKRVLSGGCILPSDEIRAILGIEGGRGNEPV